MRRVPLRQALLALILALALLLTWNSAASRNADNGTLVQRDIIAPAGGVVCNANGAFLQVGASGQVATGTSESASHSALRSGAIGAPQPIRSAATNWTRYGE